MNLEQMAAQEKESVADAALVAAVVAASGVAGFVAESRHGGAPTPGHQVSKPTAGGHAYAEIEFCVNRAWGVTGARLRVPGRYTIPNQTISWDASNPEAMGEAGAKIREWFDRLTADPAH